jgi:hypothetical protein
MLMISISVESGPMEAIPLALPVGGWLLRIVAEFLFRCAFFG